VEEARALYEWNHAKQILRIQSGSGDWDQTKMDVFSEEFPRGRDARVLPFLGGVALVVAAGFTGGVCPARRAVDERPPDVKASDPLEAPDLVQRPRLLVEIDVDLDIVGIDVELVEVDAGPVVLDLSPDDPLTEVVAVAAGEAAHQATAVEVRIDVIEVEIGEVEN
jgi:hypothetical protein